ncbi:Jag N-terminal domain-containing protein [Helicobacter suis]|uniref:Jag_N domain-containing protein n=1 Tax=Helicobacter suis TaxID=104628 RepID=A0A6J4CW62_9HELI|nr:Jag N-terminal domain-containing protein [Helicobacter suis]BCD69717.1 Jag_N domain-containing protein [Helicobacter suis]
MQTIVAKTLEEAIIKASSVLQCSVLDLEYEIIQTPSSGFLGFGKKDAIIEAKIKQAKQPQELGKTPPTPPPTPSTNSLETKITEIKQELDTLFSYLPYQIERIHVELYNEQTLLIEINGPDSALIIGEKGYRYNALSYLLFNWIHYKYHYNVRLEVASFLKDQEEIMESYLQSVIMQVREIGKAQTKPLDGMLLYIALKRLREVFPNKHVSIQASNDHESMVVINDFYK